MVGLFEKHDMYFMLFWGGRHIHFMYMLYILHSSPYLCVCGDDRIICYPGADDLTGEPGDA